MLTRTEFIGKSGAQTTKASSDEKECGLSDAEIAMLIGDKTGPAIVALTYGDVRPDYQS